MGRTEQATRELLATPDDGIDCCPAAAAPPVCLPPPPPPPLLSPRHSPLMILAANGHATAARDGLLKSCVGGISLGGSGGAPSPKRGGGAPPGGSATPTPTPTADVALVDDRGFTALHHAAAQGHVRMVKLLLSVGCSPAVRAVGPEGAGSGPTPLDVAASQEVQALLTGSSPASESKK